MKQFECPFGKQEDINLYLEGVNPYTGEYWKTVNNEIRHEKDCQNCPNYKTCNEWSVKK